MKRVFAKMVVSKCNILIPGNYIKVPHSKRKSTNFLHPKIPARYYLNKNYEKQDQNQRFECNEFNQVVCHNEKENRKTCRAIPFLNSSMSRYKCVNLRMLIYEHIYRGKKTSFVMT